jgi:RNA polymerase sigma factor (sigma-70 family)
MTDDWTTTMSNAGLVYVVARRLHQQAPWLDLDELISEGLMLLHQAVQRHDPERGRISTYGSKVVWWGLLKLIKARRVETSRDTSGGDDAAERLPDEAPTAEALLVADAAPVELHVRVEAIRASMTPEAWAVVARRTGYHDGRQWTYREIGTALDLPREAAARMYREARAALRAEEGEHG